MKRLLTGALAVAMAVSFVAPLSAGAATIAELQAQIALLTAQLSSLSGGSSSAGYTFTMDLTVGSKGADVTALQNWLIGKGYSIPAGATGYFGAQTKAAVSAWQAASGIAPAAGYFGPKSRAAVAAMGGSTTGGTTGGTTTGGITTPGVEGTLTITSSPVSGSTAYEGDSMVPVLAFKARAQTSDIAVQRVKLDLGNTTAIYNKIYQKAYVVDENGNTLASVDLNSNTVAKDNGRYFVTLAGFSYVVPKDSTKTLTIKMDVRSSIDTGDLGSRTVMLDTDGVRGADGAGIDQYGGGNSITKSITISATLTDSATLTVSTNVNSPLTTEVIAADGANNNELDKVTVLTFDIKAEKDNVLVTDLVAGVLASGGAATVPSVYLYDGNTQISNSSLSGTVATFSDIDYTVSKDSTKTFTLKVDVRNSTSVQTAITASTTAASVTAENSIGDSVSVSGSATSNTTYVRNSGPVFTLVGTPTITKSATASQNNTSTSTALATFQLHIKAVGSSVLFGSNASTTLPMVSNGTGAPARSFITYVGGAASNPASASSTDFTVPSSGVVNDVANNSFTLQEDQEVTIPVSFQVEGRTTAGALVTGGSYSIGLERINWVSAAGAASNSTFMSGLTSWRTSSISLP